MARVVVEQSFSEPLSDEEQSRMGKRLDECLRVRRGSWARTYLSEDKKRMVCQFDAPDAESVREALRSAGQQFERVWSADVYDARDYPEHWEKLQQVRAALD